MICGGRVRVSKYNLALTPISHGDEVVHCANQLAMLADSYLLGKNSLPHITLYHFEAEENKINSIWKRVEDIWVEDLIQLQFEEFSCITFDKILFWISLMPDKIDDLHRMHSLIARVLGKTIKKDFDPHMTLINTKNKECKNDVELLKKRYEPINDTFVLSLGRSDDVGQITEIIFKSQKQQGQRLTPNSKSKPFSQS